MASMYGHRWTSSYGDKDVDQTWAVGLAGLTPEQIGNGLRACVERADPWPPTLPEFRRLCKRVTRENAAAYAIRALPKIVQVNKKLARESIDAMRKSLS